MTDAIVKKACKPPMCGRCGKLVEQAYTVPLFNGPDQLGYTTTFACHGESATFEVRKDWMDGTFDPYTKTIISPGKRDIEAFVDVVFKPLPVDPAKSQSEAIRDDATNKMRAIRLRVAEFIEASITAYVENDPTFVDTTIADWCSKNKLFVGAALNEIALHDRDVRWLMLKGKVVGQFTLPFWPDEDQPMLFQKV